MLMVCLNSSTITLSTTCMFSFSYVPHSFTHMHSACFYWVSFCLCSAYLHLYRLSSSAPHLEDRYHRYLCLTLSVSPPWTHLSSPTTHLITVLLFLYMSLHTFLHLLTSSYNTTVPLVALYHILSLNPQKHSEAPSDPLFTSPSTLSKQTVVLFLSKLLVVDCYLSS